MHCMLTHLTTTWIVQFYVLHSAQLLLRWFPQNIQAIKAKIKVPKNTSWHGISFEADPTRKSNLKLFIVQWVIICNNNNDNTRFKHS